MATDIATLNSRVFLGLEAATEYLSLDKVANAVLQNLNKRTMQTRLSSTHELVALSDEFTVTNLTTDITSLIGKSVVDWVESKYDGLVETNWWAPIRVIPRVQIASYRAMGLFACAFYGIEPNSPTDQPIQYVDFTYLPAAKCRIWFNRDIQRMELASDMLLPDRFADLIVMEAQNTLIPRVVSSLTLRLRRDEEGRKDFQVIINALQGIWEQNDKVDIPPLHAEWKNWAFRAKNQETSFNNPIPRGADCYGDRNQWNTGYTPNQ